MAPAKSKQQKMSLGDFLTDETLGSWADEMEDMPTAPNRGYSVREQLPLPDKPPYTTHIGNLSFDATEGDIQDFFSGCAVTSVRIVEDKLERKPKGFGYVEYGTIDGLKKALELNGSQFQGRNIRVSVAEPQKDRPDAREFGDWTRKGPLADIPGRNRPSDRPDRGGFGGGRNFDSASEAGSERGERRRGPLDQGDGKIRDFGNWERKGPLMPVLQPGAPARDGGRPRTNDGPNNRRNSPAWGEGRAEGRSEAGSRPPRREFQDRPQYERAPTAPDLDNQWRSKMRPDAPAKSPTPTPSRETSNPPSPAAPPAPASRPKLNLQKRTVSEADPTAASPASATTDAKASPFGAAKPIDTFAKEKEIEEKRQLALREKKEQEEKVREEKRLAKEAKDAAKAEKAERPVQENGKENGTGAPQAGKNYEILRRNAEEDSAAADEDAEAEAEDLNGNIVDDKAIKPKEVVRDIPAKKTEGGAWRNKSEDKKAEASAEPSADTLEDDGWSTVATKPKNNRRGANPAARAIAS
ncbi:MAG: hypothetical protein M1836_003749 [Candelina mexicana]|nr:MAG: hypothetical protein M1836_003749 [Candelina mexicana]